MCCFWQIFVEVLEGDFIKNLLYQRKNMISNVKTWRNTNSDYVIESHGFKFRPSGTRIFPSLCFSMHLHLILSCYATTHYFYDVN